ncbi:hypothetical protein Tco_1289292 [Tanacetum coccineum]
MADQGKKSSMETFTPNDKAYYYSGITSITVNEKNAYELKGKFLDDLLNNAFSGTNGKDADPVNPRFEGWLATKFVNYKTMDIFTKGALWDYWKIGGDEIKVSDDESSDLEEYRSDKEEETAKIFKIETNVFDYETPLCLAFSEFNYLLKVDLDLLTKDIMGFKTYEDYKDDWIYEWNENVPWVYDKPWLDNGIWKEPKPVKHDCKPFNIRLDVQNGQLVVGERMVIVMEEIFPELTILETRSITKTLNGSISDDESCNDGWRRWEDHEITYHDHDEIENETHDERQELCKAHELPICNIRRFKMIKYSFGQDEEYVAIKEDEYDDLARTSDDTCRAYQEIFRMIDEGWMVTRAE